MFDKAVPHFFSSAAEVLEDSVLVLALTVILAVFDKRSAVAQHVVDDAGQFVGSSSDGFGHANLCSLASEKGPERTPGVMEGLDCNTQRGGRYRLGRLRWSGA